MRTSIKLVALGITIAIFIMLNIYWTLAVPPGNTLETNNVAYYIPLVVILLSMFIIAFYFYSKSKQKTKIKL